MQQPGNDMRVIHRQHMQSANAIFNVEDRFARARAIRAKHPRPIGNLRYYLIGEIVSGVRSDYTRPSELLVVRTPGGYDVFFDQLRYRDGEIYRMDIEEGIYVVLIESEFYQLFEGEFSLPGSTVAIDIDLEPGYQYPFPQANLPNVGSPTLLRGTLFAYDEKPASGVMIEVVGKSNQYITDASGQWVLVFNDDQETEEVTVRMQWSDNSVVEVPIVPVEKGQVRTLTQAGLRGWVQNNAGVALPNVEISVLGRTHKTMTETDGSWFYYFDLNQGEEIVSVSARLPDGTLLSKDNIQVQTRSVVIVPTFKFA